jgi:glycosyltransferase 2 family protein
VIVRSLRIVVPFAISAGLLYLVVRSISAEPGQVIESLVAANWWFLPVAVGLYFIGVWLRSARWGLLLPEHTVKTSTLFRALVVGFTVNNLLPLRIGEVARTYLLNRWCRIPYGATIASLVVERVLDGLSLAMLLLVALTVVPAPGYLRWAGGVAALGFLAGAAVLALGAWRTSAITAVARFIARFLPARFRAVVERLAASFARALVLVHDPLRLTRVLGLSLLAWCFELGLFFVLLLAFRLPGSYPLALLVGSAGNFATLIPSSPGYAGTFDAAVIAVLQSPEVGIPAFLATAYDFAVHMTLLVPVTIVGTLVLWRSHVTFGQITHASAPVSAELSTPPSAVRTRL